MADNRYHHGKIYSIRSHQTDEVYIGSTCSTLTKRLSQHKANFKSWCKDNKNKYLTSYKILKNIDYYIELVEEIKCETKRELCKREGEIIRATDNCVNRKIEGRTDREYYFDNQEKSRQRYQDNKEHVIQNVKIYQQNHKEQVLGYKRTWKAKNQEYLKQKHICECGGTYTPSHKTRHFRTKKHMNYNEKKNI